MQQHNPARKRWEEIYYKSVNRFMDASAAGIPYIRALCGSHYEMLL